MKATYTDHPGELVAIRQDVPWQVIRDGYASAYRGVFGKPVQVESLAILLAHSALETGRWKKGLWNWNLGNIKASMAYADKPGNHHQYYRLNEYLKQKDGSYRYEWFDPTHPQTRMRGYRTCADGAGQKVRFLGTASNPARGNRYGRAWEALEDGDPQAFSQELRKAGYYTAKEAPYTRAMVSLFSEFRALLDEQPATIVTTPTAPLAAEEYDDSMPLHSAVTDSDLARMWIGQPIFGLPDDVYADLARLKKEDLLDD